MISDQSLLLSTTVLNDAQAGLYVLVISQYKYDILHSYHLMSIL